MIKKQSTTKFKPASSLDVFWFFPVPLLRIPVTCPNQFTHRFVRLDGETSYYTDLQRQHVVAYFERRLCDRVIDRRFRLRLAAFDALADEEYQLLLDERFRLEMMEEGGM